MTHENWANELRDELMGLVKATVAGELRRVADELDAPVDKSPGQAPAEEREETRDERRERIRSELRAKLRTK